MVKTNEFTNRTGEKCRAVYNPVSHQWYAHSIDTPFHATKPCPSLSEAILLASIPLWMPLEELVELAR